MRIQVDLRGPARARGTRDRRRQRSGAAGVIAGLVVAGVFMIDRIIFERIRTIAFASLASFFLRVGTLISASALVTGAGVIGALFAVKMMTKFVGVRPTSTYFRLPKRERTYTTLLTATGLTFGSIAAL